MIDHILIQANNECATSIYGPNGYCGFGRCIVDNPTHSHCECFQGFRNDLSFTRHPNCYLPAYGVEVLAIFALIVSILTFLFNIFSIRNAVSTARSLSLTCIGISGSSVLMYAIYIGQGYMLRTPALIMTWLVVSTSAAALNLATFSLVSPIYAALHRPIKNFKNIQIGSFLVARVALLAPIISACYFDSLPPSAMNNLKFSYSLETFIFILGIDSLVSFLNVIYNAKNMAKFIDEVALSQLSLSSSPAKFQKYLDKISLMKKRAILGLTFIGGLCIVSSLIQFIAGSIPFVFAMYVLGSMTGCFIALFLGAYARKYKNENVDSSKRKSDTNPVSSSGLKVGSVTDAHRRVVSVPKFFDAATYTETGKPGSSIEPYAKSVAETSVAPENAN